MTRPGDPSASTVKALITLARGMCQFQGCTDDLVVDQKFRGMVAHIVAAQGEGPRHDGNFSIEQIKAIDNVLLLCPNHHDVIDNSPEIYTVEYLREIKKEHEANYSNILSKIPEHKITQFAWESKFAKFSQGVISSIPKTINGSTIPRDSQIEALAEQLDQSSKIIVIGDKGSGKSVLLAQLCQNLIDDNKNALFVKCDDYLEVESLDELKRIVDDDKSILEIIDEVCDESNPLIVICDSLDAVSRNRKSMNLFKNFLKLLWGMSNVKTICSIRKYDYEYTHTINQTDWGKEHDLALLTQQELNEMLIRLGSPNVPDRLKTILTNPLHLKLLSLILHLSPNADFGNIKNEIELYEEHWKEYVKNLESPSEVRSMLYDIVQKMSSLQKTVIQYNEFNNPPVMHQILSRGIILQDEFSDKICFFHHAYLDYVMSRFILERDGEVVDYIQEHEYNIFLRPTIIFTLSLFNKRAPKKFVKIIEGMLDPQLKTFWRISALTTLAKIVENDNQDFTNLGRFLTADAILQRHFLIEITKYENAFWFNMWSDSFFAEWSEKATHNSWFITNYLKSITPHVGDHQRIFNLLQRLVAKNGPDPAKREAVKLSSRLNVEGKADWLLELSSDSDIHIRNGVVDILPKLVETRPNNAPDIFCNLFTYVETSDEKTTVVKRGTFEMTSTRSQDNRLIIWRMGELFPELLEKNPSRMIMSSIKVFETLRAEELIRQEGSPIEDNGRIWFFSPVVRHVSDENKILLGIISYLNNCTVEKLTELIPVFGSTRLATFHSILLESLVKRRDKFIDEIFQIISNPQVYKIPTMRKSVRTAIKKVCTLLKQEQIEKILNLIMNIGKSYGESSEGEQILNKRKAEFLSEFSENMLSMRHREILADYSKTSLKYQPPYSRSARTGTMPQARAHTEQEPEKIIAENMHKGLEGKQKIRFLEAVTKYLEKETEEIDKMKFSPIRKVLVENKDDPDPQNDEKYEGGLLLRPLTVRGLVARCTVQLLYHSKDETLVPIVKELSDDPTNVVREEMCTVLSDLLYYDYDLAHSLAKQYSRDPDLGAFYFLFGALWLIADRNPKHATIIVSNILNTSPTDYQKMHGIEGFLLYLAFQKKENGAINLLNKIVDDGPFPPEIRRNIPFELKERYLFQDEFQDRSLDLLYRLLDDPDHDVREKAAFFTLVLVEKNASTNNEKSIRKIERHMDRIVSEVEKQPMDPRLIEHLVDFLKEFWHLLPEKTIDYLEKIITEKVRLYSVSQPVFASASVKILTGIFQQPSLSKRNQERCLDILDKYSAIGWPDALQLLSAMERPD